MSPIPTLSSLSATTITLYLAISVAHHTRSPAQEAGPTRPTQGRLSQHRQGPASSLAPSELAPPELAPPEAAAAIAAGAAEAAGAG